MNFVTVDYHFLLKMEIFFQQEKYLSSPGNVHNIMTP